MIMRSNFVCAAIALTICMFAMTTKLLYSKLHFSLIAIAIGAVHLAAVLLNAVMIEVSMGNPGPSEALMGWLLFDLIDFPSTLLQLLKCSDLQQRPFAMCYITRRALGASAQQFHQSLRNLVSTGTSFPRPRE